MHYKLFAIKRAKFDMNDAKYHLIFHGLWLIVMQTEMLDHHLHGIHVNESKVTYDAFRMVLEPFCLFTTV